MVRFGKFRVPKFLWLQKLIRQPRHVSLEFVRTPRIHVHTQYESSTVYEMYVEVCGIKQRQSSADISNKYVKKLAVIGEKWKFRHQFRRAIFFHYLASKLENAFALSCLTSVPSTVFILDIKLKVLADTVGMDSLLTASQHAFISIRVRLERYTTCVCI